jgi:hypothetical protein
LVRGLSETLNLLRQIAPRSDGVREIGIDRVCGSAWKKDPVSGVIGVEEGPLILMV